MGPPGIGDVDLEGCFVVGNRGSTGGIGEYSVEVGFVDGPVVDLFMIYSKEYPQSIQTNHPHTPLYQPQSLLLAPVNTNYGRCYNYDINNIQNTINIIFYPNSSPSSTHQNLNSTITIPGTKLQNKYTIQQIRSIRTGEIITYKVVIRGGSFLQEDDVEVCFGETGAFTTKVVDQFDNFGVLF